MSIMSSSLVQSQTRNVSSMFIIAKCAWDAEDGLDLLQRLSQLEKQSQGAPLVSIVEGTTAPHWQDSCSPDKEEDEAAGGWEML